MRLMMLFTVGLVFQLSATGFAQSVRMTGGEQTLKAVFEQVEKQTGKITLFSNNELDMNKTVRLEAKSFTLEDLYSQLLRGMGLTFEITDGYVVIRKVDEKSVKDEDVKSVTVVGRVTDTKRQPIPGVTVLVKEMNIGTATNAEGHYELVKLNLDNPEVQQYLFDSVTLWIRQFDIDGIRLDVAYSLPRWFMAKLKAHCENLKKDFFLVGEVMGDNAGYMFSEAHLDSITDYPGFKGLWSSFNTMNMFELAHTLKRNYGEMYKDKDLLTFVDNHDVERIASKLDDPDKLPLIYGLLLALPGIPCIYYGSEWGATGKKEPGSDDSLRPEYTEPHPNELTNHIKKLISLRNSYLSLQQGDYQELALTNKQFVFERTYQDERIIVALNLDNDDYYLHFNARAGRAIELIRDKEHDFGGGSKLPPKSIQYWLIND